MATISILTPVPPGAAPAMSRCTHATRERALFDALAAGWSGYRGRPWAGAYSNILARVPGLRSLRLALADPPAVLLQADLADDAALDVLHDRFGPVLDLVFAGCAGYPGGGSASSFREWARRGSAIPPLSLVRELDYAQGAHAPSDADDHRLKKYAVADFERLSPLYALPGESGLLRDAAARLVPSVQDRLAHAGAFAGDALTALLQPIQAPAQSFLQGVGQFFSGLFGAGGPNKVQVKGKRQVMEVLTDVNARYSVCGYAPRMEASLGLIYLGMDRSDPRYGQQSTLANAAIGEIDELEGFTAAMEATHEAIREAGNAPHFDIKDLSDTVLAKLCAKWFDIPDGEHVIASGSIWPGVKGHCPGHYGPVSGSIFQPDPIFGLPLLARIDGERLRSGVGAFVKAQREKGVPPPGRLSGALFAAFPSAAQDDLLTSTIIGVMMGFLPTAQGNLLAIFSYWDEQRIGTLREALMAEEDEDIWVRAQKIVREPMIEGMQQAPVPPQIWRTATKDHDLDGVAVRKNDLVHINLDSATREDLAKGVRDPTPIFGGDRTANPYPTHACPGLKMGMGVLLGFCTAVLESQQPPSAFTALSATAVH
jgi:hypothetical protein